MSKVLGRFVWHELHTNDVDAGLAFYKKVVGWSTQSWEQDSSYTMLLGSNGPVGGCMGLTDEMQAGGTPPHWVTYIGTPDVDETAREAESLGGRILHEPADIPNMGRFAFLQDPQGAMFAIYGAPPGSPEPSDDPPLPGEFSWHELITTDLDAAWEFYSRLFGWNKTSSMDMGGGMGLYQMFGVGGAPLGGMYVKPPDMPAPPNWLPYAKVKDARGATATAEQLGAQIMVANMEVPGGDLISIATDPQGAAFAVHSAAPAAAVKPVAAAKPAAAKPARAKAAKKASKPRKAKPKKAAKKKAAKKATKKKVAKRRAPKKAAKKKAARRRAPKKAARKAARKKAARRPAKKKAARKSAKKRAMRKAPRRRMAKRPARRKKK